MVTAYQWDIAQIPSGYNTYKTQEICVKFSMHFQGRSQDFWGCTHGHHNVQQVGQSSDTCTSNLFKRTLSLAGRLYARASVRTLWLRP